MAARRRTSRPAARRRKPTRTRPTGGFEADLLRDLDRPPSPSRGGDKQGSALPKIVGAVFVAGALYASGMRIDWPIGGDIASATGRGAQRVAGYVADGATGAASWTADQLRNLNEQNNNDEGNG